MPDRKNEVQKPLKPSSEWERAARRFMWTPLRYVAGVSICVLLGYIGLSNMNKEEDTTYQLTGPSDFKKVHEKMGADTYQVENEREIWEVALAHIRGLAEDTKKVKFSTLWEKQPPAVIRTSKGYDVAVWAIMYGKRDSFLVQIKKTPDGYVVESYSKLQ